ncbi:MAG TPA: Hpt domain-containing protein [Holophagaceae bacterium]|nr:Hpt domain-containing protein [Holophagaceae bacterium]
MADIPPEILDPEVLQTLLSLDDGGFGLVREMTGLFREDIGSRLEVLDKAWPSGDIKAVAEMAHAIKGAAGAVGARTLQKLAGDVEKAGRGGDLTPVAPLRSQLRPAFEAALAALERFGQG